MAFQPYTGIARSYYLGFHRCPNCKEDVFAAEGATLTAIGLRRQESLLKTEATCYL
jgi:hypothetical protein